MSRPAKHNEFREILMDGAVKAVSLYGLEGATTKAITECCHVNESYIYRYYMDKEDILTKAFLRLDRNAFGVFKMNGFILHDNSQSFQERFQKYFDICWDYVTRDLDSCKFYVRFYYSSFFNRQIIEIHRRIAIDCFESFQQFVIHGIDFFTYLHYVCLTFFDQAMQVALGVLPNTEEIRATVFKVVFGAVDAITDKDKIKNYYGKDN